MKTEGELRRMLKEIEDDERLHYPCANVQINAPLALIQVALEAQRAILLWALNLKGRPLYTRKEVKK